MVLNALMSIYVKNGLTTLQNAICTIASNMTCFMGRPAQLGDSQTESLALYAFGSV